MLKITSISQGDQKSIAEFSRQRKKILISEYSIHPSLVEQTSIKGWKDLNYFFASEASNEKVLGGVVVCFSISKRIPVHFQLRDYHEMISEMFTPFDMGKAAQLCGIFISKSNTDPKLAENICLNAIDFARARGTEYIIVLCNKFGERILQRLNFTKLEAFGGKGYINYPTDDWESYMYVKEIV